MAGKDKSDHKAVIRYCQSDLCTGRPIDAVVEDQDIDESCPVCYESFDERKVAVLKPCKHLLCTLCSKEVKKPKCPVCRSKVTNKLYLSTPIKSEINDIDIQDHLDCDYNLPELKEHLEGLNEEWLKFAKFMLQSWLKVECSGIKGTEILNLQRVEDEDRLVHKGERFIIQKTKEGKTQVVVCCAMPCLSIRLVITKQDSVDYEINNEYADTVIGYFNKQIQACWRVIPELINRQSIEKIYVRKFKNVNCFLLFSGFNDRITQIHFDDMRKELGTIEMCNFDKAAFNTFRDIFPPLLCKNLKIDKSYYNFDCCTDYKKQNEGNGNSQRLAILKEIFEDSVGSASST